jgi:hypothetical protein
MGRKSASGSGIRNEQPGSYFLELSNHFCGFFGVKILKFFDADPGWKKVGSGIRDKHPGSATLVASLVRKPAAVASYQLPNGVKLVSLSCKNISDVRRVRGIF